MKLFIILLVIAIFIQSSFLPLNICLILIICRSLTIDDASNYWLAFFAGLSLSLLNGQNLGFSPLVFLLIVKLTSLLKRLPISSNILTILPFTFFILSLSGGAESLFFNQSFDLRKVLLETIFSLPIFLLIKVWEDRYMVKHEIKLKIGK